MIRICKKSSNSPLRDSVHRADKIWARAKVRIKYHNFKLMDLRDQNQKKEILCQRIKRKLQNKRLLKRILQTKKTEKIKEGTRPNRQMIFK